MTKSCYIPNSRIDNQADLSSEKIEKYKFYAELVVLRSPKAERSPSLFLI
ncbi:hypothetical protein ACQFX9_17465 [Aliinostoc sp. HNIBRCY26]